ncbi:MAG: DUF6526 family protein [Sphingobacteriales bacterium]|jgi:hypothetical protein
MTQNYSNHTRYHATFHFVVAPLGLIGLIWSIVHLLTGKPENHYNAALITIAFILLFLIGALTRTYALKAQDRAIRAEENLRHFILTGKALDSRLRLGQIIALRFASDEEFPGLASKAAEEKMSGKDIKQSIQKWRADYYRI